MQPKKKKQNKKNKERKTADTQTHTELAEYSKNAQRMPLDQWTWQKAPLSVLYR